MKTNWTPELRADAYLSETASPAEVNEAILRLVEERESLEMAPEAHSLEIDPRRGERAVVDQDDAAEQVIAQRLAAAEANAAPRTRADHVAFDSRIRQEPADKTATRGYTLQQLRKAVVWREILGPPVSMRREEER